jgi:renalase
LFVIVTAVFSGAILLLSNSPSAPLALAIAAVAIYARQVLMPRINAARDKQLQGNAETKGRFGRLHGLSVVLNFVQLIIAGYVLYRFLWFFFIVLVVLRRTFGGLLATAEFFMMRIGIVGAGMAGLACAEDLTRLGHAVLLFDKGRGPGGRMATRRIQTSAGEAYFDHGAQYFTVRDDAFRQQVAAWMSEGVAAAWPSAGCDGYVGVPTMNAPLGLMANGQSVQWATLVTQIEEFDRLWRLVLDQGEAVDVDIAVVATPAEQASDLLSSVAPDFAAQARAAASAPCWTLMLAFFEAVAVAQNCWRGGDIIGWAARNSSKPGRIGPESWVVQASRSWSRLHIEADPKWVSATIKEALSRMLGSPLPPVTGESCHRWRFARSGADGSGALFDLNRHVGICGDWLIGPRVEAAWLSGKALAEQIGDGPTKHVP